VRKLTSPTGRYLLDTNIIIALLASDESVKEHLVSIEEVFLPSIAIGELYYGAYRSSRRDEQHFKHVEGLQIEMW
jgi:tRNA(fMet)-specific endonuclease VapC